MNYTLSELLEMLCEHDDCPEWLAEGIWNLFARQKQAVVYSRLHWQASFEAIEAGKEVLDSETIQ